MINYTNITEVKKSVIGSDMVVKDHMRRRFSIRFEQKSNQDSILSIVANRDAVFCFFFNSWVTQPTAGYGLGGN